MVEHQHTYNTIQYIDQRLSSLRIFFRNQPISNKNCLQWTCLLTDRDEMSILYRGPSIAATYQVLVHLTKRFQRRRFFMNRPISNTNCLCWPCLLTDPKLAIFIEGLPQMLPTTFRFIWPSGFRVEDFFKNRPISNENCLCRPCLLRDRD